MLPWSSPYDRQLAESVQSVVLNSLGLVAVVRGGLQESLEVLLVPSVFSEGSRLL